MIKNRHTLCILFIFLLGGIVSCEKVIDIPLKDTEPLLVIEANIDNNSLKHEVVLAETTSFSYSGKRKPVSGAIVIMNQEGRRPLRLKEEEEGHYVLHAKAVPGKTYHLSVSVNGKEYEARSTMPEPVLMDSIGTIEISFLNEIEKSAAVVYQDPPHVKNYYRFTATVNGVDDEAFWVFNDKFTDGKTVTQSLNDFSLKLKKNDLVKIEFQCIDSAVYSYWKGIQDQHPGGMVPANPVSNLSNGALGYFSAHSTSSSSFVVD